MKNKQNRMRMDYLYRNEWKTKDVTMDELWQQVKDGKYLRLVKGVRGEDAVATRAGLGIKDVAANDLPKIWPAWETDGTYTGRVLLSLRIADDGQLFRWLRQRVSEMQQTEWLMTGSSGTSLKVVMRYSLPDGTFPTEEQARKLFQQYAFRRACDFMQAATGVKAEDDEHYGTGWFRISADPDAYWNAEPAAIPMSQPLKPLTEHSAPITQPTKEPELSHEVLPGYSRLEMDLTKFSMICRNLSFQEKKEPQQYLLQLACECRKAGVDQEVAAKSVLVMEPFRGKETLVNTTFDNAYNSHLLGSNNPIEPALMNQQLMKAFLKKCYHFRRNTKALHDTRSNAGYGHPGKPCGLIASAFRPSDDSTIFPYLVPSNFFAVSVLRKAATILRTVNKENVMAGECEQMASQVEAALKQYAVVEHPKYGPIYAFEVDGYGSYLLMDDSNAPSLLCLPYLTDVAIDDPVYQNTRKFVWSEDNPYFFKGKAGEGIGGPHCGLDKPWPMSLVMKGFTTNDRAEKEWCVQQILKTDGGKGFMHESFNKDDATDFTRSWFAWANTIFGELIVDMYAE